MAFGEVYGYKTKSRFVVASAESRERTIDNPNYVNDQETPGVDEQVTVVDLVLHGFANGRRNNCPVVKDVGNLADVPVNSAVPAAQVDALSDGTEPGQTTGGFPDGTYSGGVSDRAGGSTQGGIA